MKKKKKPYTPENIRRQLQDMRTNYHEIKHYRKPWSDADIGALKELFYDGVDLSRIAIYLERTEKAVIKQIDNLELYKKVYNKSDKKKACKCPKCKLDGTDDCTKVCDYAR